jgi:cation transport ATPase
MNVSYTKDAIQNNQNKDVYNMNLLESQLFFAKVLSLGYLGICMILLMLGIFQNPYWMAIPMFVSIPTIVSFGFLLSFTYWLSLDKAIVSSDVLIFIDISIHVLLNLLILRTLGKQLGKMIYKLNYVSKSN